LVQISFNEKPQNREIVNVSLVEDLICAMKDDITVSSQ